MSATEFTVKEDWHIPSTELTLRTNAEHPPAQYNIDFNGTFTVNTRPASEAVEMMSAVEAVGPPLWSILQYLNVR